MTSSILPAAWRIPPALRDRVGNRPGRQRAMLEDDHLLLVTHVPPKPDETTRRGRFFWRNPHGDWAWCEEPEKEQPGAAREGGDGTTGLRKHLDAYASAIQAVDQAEEQGQTANDYFQVIDRLAPVLRATRHLHQVLQESRKLVPEARELIDFRDRAYELERTAELLLQDAKNSLDFLVARQAERQAQSSFRMEQASYRLNLLVAFFFPLATLLAFFGMNLAAMLVEMREHPVAFAVLIAGGLLTGFFLKALIGGKPPQAT